MKLIDKSPKKKLKYLAYFRGMQALIQEAKEENDNNQNDDFKKTIGFHDQNISHARASRFFVHFFDVHCTTTT